MSVDVEPGKRPAGISPVVLDGRVIAITGAGRGLGLFNTRTLLLAGARVVANYGRTAEDLEKLQAEYPDQLTLVPGDIGEEDTCVRLAQAARAAGGPDVLVHNAGVARDGLLVQMSADDWDEVQRVNLRAAFLATKHAVRAMMRRRYGRVIYISSISATLGNGGQANYASSKSGLDGLARSVAQEYASFNIRSVVLAIGLVDSGLGAALPEKVQAEKLSRVIIGPTKPVEVAGTVAFLASSAADGINATVIRMDGGVKF